MVLLRLLKWLLALFDVFSSKLLLSSQRHNNNSRQPAAQPTEISTLEYIHFTITIHMIVAYLCVWTGIHEPSEAILKSSRADVADFIVLKNFKLNRKMIFEPMIFKLWIRSIATPSGLSWKLWFEYTVTIYVIFSNCIQLVNFVKS